jgi:hypothetical protein
MSGLLAESLKIDGTILEFICDEDLSTDFKIGIRLHRVKILEGIKKISRIMFF